MGSAKKYVMAGAFALLSIPAANAADLAPVEGGNTELVALAAAWLGNTRLIDNVELRVG